MRRKPLILEILDYRGKVHEVIRTVDGVAVAQNEAAVYLLRSMGQGIWLGDRECYPEDGDDYLRAVAAHLDGCYSVPRLREEF